MFRQKAWQRFREEANDYFDILSKHWWAFLAEGPLWEVSRPRFGKAGKRVEAVDGAGYCRSDQVGRSA
jgi:hypothetical protein